MKRSNKKLPRRWSNIEVRGVTNKRYCSAFGRRLKPPMAMCLREQDAKSAPSSPISHGAPSDPSEREADTPKLTKPNSIDLLCTYACIRLFVCAAGGVGEWNPHSDSSMCWRNPAWNPPRRHTMINKIVQRMEGKKIIQRATIRTMVGYDGVRR